MKNLNDILVELLVEAGHDEMDISCYKLHWAFNRSSPMAKDIVIRITAFPKEPKYEWKYNSYNHCKKEWEMTDHYYSSDDTADWIKFEPSKRKKV